MKTALAKVVTFRANTHDGGAGEALAEKYAAHGLPHFVLMDASGTARDRWIGYRGPESWLRAFNGAIADPASIEEKEKRFKTEPTEALAAALGRIHTSLHEGKEAVAFYREAERMAGSPKAAYEAEIYLQQWMGLGDGTFTLDELRASADAVMAASDSDPLDMLTVASTMGDVAKDRKDPSLFAPYAGPALEAASGMSDQRAVKMRHEIEIAQALLVKGDKGAALELERASMPPGWDQDADKLNEFAWWCFEAQVNLEEAERLARRGIDLAKPGAQKAQLLDTAAEICNLLGSCDDAVTLAEQAAK